MQTSVEVVVVDPRWVVVAFEGAAETHGSRFDVKGGLLAWGWSLGVPTQCNSIRVLRVQLNQAEWTCYCKTHHMIILSVVNSRRPSMLLSIHNF